MTDRRSIVLSVLAVALLAAVVVDLARRAVERPAAPARHAPAETTPATAGRAGPVRRAALDTSRTLAAAVAATERLDPATRSAVLRRISVEGAGTYVPTMLVSGDSAIHRWGDDRAARPIHVGAVRSAVPGFRDAFVANLGWAVSRWNGVGLPVFLEQDEDTVGADIVVTWAERLDSNRAGRADVTWQGGGPITHVHITLATHTPDGRAVLPSQMVALALHELGHALGLGHSPEAGDALYPQTSATELTTRDRRTAALLYAIPPGSLK
jgi:hypothetical protein